MSFSSFRNTVSVENLQNSLQNLNKKFTNPTTEDDTYYTYDHIRGPEGTGSVTLRLLPPPPTEDGGIENDPIVKYTDNSYQHPETGRWYINRSRTSLGKDEPDPCAEFGRTVWNDKSLTKEQKIAKSPNRRDWYIAGVKVIKDPLKPENEGKVFRFKFGQQIYNVINEALIPTVEGVDPISVFDPFEGADFILHAYSKAIPTKDGSKKSVPVYDKSRFATPKPMCDEDEFEEIWKSQYSLASEIAPDKFKDYDTLLKEWNRISSGGPKKTTEDEPIMADVVANLDFKPKGEAKAAKPNESLSKILDDEIPFDDPKPKTTKKTKANVESSEDPLEWFNSLK